MFDRNSRYYHLTTLTLTVRELNGTQRQVRYVQRRFITSETGWTLVEHSVTQGDRLDNMTARYLGDATQFWRVCDANTVLDPDELTDTIGRIIRIALPSS